MRNSLGSCANSDYHFAAKLLCAFHDAVGKHAPMQMWLNSRQDDEIARTLWVAGNEEVIFGPANESLTIFVNKCFRAFLSEIKKWVGVNRGHHGDGTVLNCPLQSTCSHATHVKPAAQSNHQNRVAQRSYGLPVGV